MRPAKPSSCQVQGRARPGPRLQSPCPGGLELGPCPAHSQARAPGSAVARARTRTAGCEMLGARGPSLPRAARPGTGTRARPARPRGLLPPVRPEESGGGSRGGGAGCREGRARAPRSERAGVRSPRIADRPARSPARSSISARRPTGAATDRPARPGQWGWGRAAQLRGDQLSWAAARRERGSWGKGLSGCCGRMPSSGLRGEGEIGPGRAAGYSAQGRGGPFAHVRSRLEPEPAETCPGRAAGAYPQGTGAAALTGLGSFRSCAARAANKGDVTVRSGGHSAFTRSSAGSSRSRAAAPLPARSQPPGQPTDSRDGI